MESNSLEEREDLASLAIKTHACHSLNTSNKKPHNISFYSNLPLAFSSTSYFGKSQIKSPMHNHP